MSCEDPLSQWLALVRLDVIKPILEEKNVTSIETISLLTLEDVTSIKENLPLLTAKRFQKEFIDKFGPFNSPKQEPQSEIPINRFNSPKQEPQSEFEDDAMEVCNSPVMRMENDLSSDAKIDIAYWPLAKREESLTESSSQKQKREKEGYQEGQTTVETWQPAKISHERIDEQIWSNKWDQEMNESESVIITPQVQTHWIEQPLSSHDDFRMGPKQWPDHGGFTSEAEPIEKWSSAKSNDWYQDTYQQEKRQNEEAIQKWQTKIYDNWSEKLPAKQEPQSEIPTNRSTPPQGPPQPLHSKYGKEVGEFVANTSEDLDQYLDSKRIQHELALEEECLEFLIDIIAQEESPTLYSKCNFEEGAKRRVCLSRDAHTARLQRLRKYRTKALERERSHPFSSMGVHAPTEIKPTSKPKKTKGRRVTIDPRFIVEETDEGLFLTHSHT
jgi:hypothetical protein